MEKEISKRLFLLVLVLIAALVMLNSFNNFDNKNKLVSKAVASDLIAPSVTITSPDDFYQTNNPSLLVSGIASDNINIKEVRIKVNNDVWEIASGTTSWSKVLNLINGENTVYVQAFDNSNNASPISSINILYNPGNLNENKAPPSPPSYGTPNRSPFLT